MNIKKKKSTPYIHYIAFGIILSLLPLLQVVGVLNSSTIITLGAVIFYAIVGIGLNVLLGYSGLVSLGTAGFMGLGAYVSAYLTNDLKMDFILAMIIAISISLLIGLIIGLISLRIEGFYLAIATLGVAEILRRIFEEMEFLTGGFSGKSAGYPKLFGNIIKLDKNTTFIFMSIILVLIMIFTYNFIHSKTGRALLTMRVSEAAAQAMGINILRLKIISFAIATAYASLGGVLYVHFIRFSYPSTWGIMLSLQLIAVIVIGGVRTISGPILGSFVVFGVPELILKQLPILGNIDGLAYIFNGVLIIIIVLFYPSGLINITKDIKKIVSRRKNWKTKISGGDDYGD